MTDDNRKEIFKDFIYSVRKMRECQKKYFSSRNVNVMRESKQWEARVDGIIAKIDDRSKLKLPLEA